MKIKPVIGSEAGIGTGLDLPKPRDSGANIKNGLEARLRIKISVLGTVSIPWALIDTTNSQVSAAGVAVGTVQLSGKLGESFTIESVRIL